MSEPRQADYRLPARVLALALLIALPLFAGRLYLWQALAATEAVALCALLALVAAAFIRARAPANGSRFGWAELLLVSFFVWLALATVGSVYLHASLVGLAQIGSYLVLMWLCASLFQGDRWRRRAWLAVGIGGVLASFVGLREYAHTAILQGDRSWRIFGTFYNPNCLAGYLLAVIPAAVVILAAAWGAARGEDERQRPRYGLILAGFVLLLPVAALLLTASRAGALGAMLAAVVFAVAGPRRIRGRWLALALVALIAVVAVAPPLRARVLQFTAQSHSAIFRWYTWRGAVDMVRARPLLGFGPGTFEFAYQRFAQAGFTRMAHQTPLQIAAESGLPALAALLAALVLLARELLMGVRAGGPRAVEAVAGLAALAALGLQNLLDYTWYVPAVGLTLAAVVGLARAAAQPEADRTQPGRRPSRALTWLGAVACLMALAIVGRALQAQTLAARGRALLAEGRHDLALGWLQQARRIDPLDAAILEDISSAAVASGSRYALARAVAARQRAAALCPLNPGNFLVLAQLEAARSNHHAALGYARQAVELGPNYGRAYVVLAQLLERTGDHHAALDTYRRLEAVYDSPVGKYQAVEEITDYSYAYAWLELGREAQATGEHHQALRYFERAEQLTGEYARFQRGREEAFRLMGVWDESDVIEAERLEAEAALAARKAGRQRQERVQP